MFPAIQIEDDDITKCQAFTKWLHALSHFNPSKDFIDLFSETWGEGREKERETLDVQDIHLTSCLLQGPPGDLTLNPGMCPDWESYW